MSQKELNLGILAHVDAGKTTLTERLLYEAGVIDDVGSVDAGTTQTDSLALEQQRGITIKSAVASFAIEDVHVNLIDTPGHPDFIAEVERVLSVLDGAVLVLSAVEGVQPQTRILMRALQRLRIPTLIFVNKIDRPGADPERVLGVVSRRLSTAIIAMGAAREVGTRAALFALFGAHDPAFRAGLAEVLAERDEAILAAYVEDQSGVPFRRLREALTAQTRRGLVHPVFFGSALTGAGVELLMQGIADLLPVSSGDPDGPVSGTVFKIERDATGPQGRIRSAVLGDHPNTRPRALRSRSRGARSQASRSSTAGLPCNAHRSPPAPSRSSGVSTHARIGDRLGEAGTRRQRRSVSAADARVRRRAVDADDRQRLRLALAELAEQDPLIDVRQDDAREEISVSLYGEVQKEVIQATLSGEYGIDVDFRETSTIHIERPAGTGEAVEVLYAKTKTNVTGKSSPLSTNPFLATLALRVEPAPIGSGIEFRLDVDVRFVPIYIYKGVDAFIDHMARYVREALHEGLLGWQVTDCAVTMTGCGYRAPGSTSADFRKLTPLVLMQALGRAGTVVCEPIVRVVVEVPADTIGAVMAALAGHGAAVDAPAVKGELAVIETALPAARVRELQRQLPALAKGEGVLESDFAGYERVSGPSPTRRRTTANPLDRDAYLLQAAGRATRS